MNQQKQPSTTTRRQLLGGTALAGLGALGLTGLPALAQTAPPPYPNKPIELIVPFPPGGGTDALGRALAESTRKYLGQPLIIVNKAGASGGVGWAELVAARPDGYKLAIITVEITIIPHMGSVRFTADDVIPIARLNSDPATIAVRADSPIRNIEELLASAQVKGEGIRVGNAGAGSLGHLAAASLADKTGTNFVHVAYRGAGPGLLDLVGGHIDALSLTPPDMASFVADGKVRPLAVMGDRRIGSGWENIPTLKERNIDVVVYGWRAIGAPRGTPPEVIAVLREAVARAMQEPAMKESMQKMNLGEGYLDQPAFRDVIHRDNVNFKRLIEKLDIRA